MLLGQPLVAEVAVDFVHPIQTAHSQALQVQFRGDPQEQIDIQRVVMRLKGPCQCTAVERLHHRGFDFDVTALLEARAELPDDLVSGHKRLPDRVVADQVQRPLPVADLDILQAMELLGRWKHALG